VISPDDVAELVDAVRAVARAISSIDMAAGCHAEIEELVNMINEAGNQLFGPLSIIADALVELTKAVKRLNLREVPQT